MKPIRGFEDYVMRGIVKKQMPDKSRANFLLKESENSYKFLLNILERVKIDDENANNFVKDCYDIFMQLIRAKMLLDGFNSSGLGAHEAEVSYLRVLGFNEKDVQFADQVRFFRNGTLYYGTPLDEEYAQKVVAFTKDTVKIV